MDMKGMSPSPIIIFAAFITFLFLTIFFAGLIYALTNKELLPAAMLLSILITAIIIIFLPPDQSRILGYICVMPVMWIWIERRINEED